MKTRVYFRPLLRMLVALLLGIVCHGRCLAQESRLLYAEDFEEVQGESPPAPIRDNSGWAGSSVPLRVVDSGDPRYGNVLRGEVDGFAQLMLGALGGLRKDGIYRISLDAATKGTHRPEIFLRLGPSPYRVYMTSTETTTESMQRFSYIGKSVHDVEQQVVLMLRLNGVTLLTIDNIRIEEILGDLPASAPPKAGNRLFNASFENSWDGWFVRGNIDFPAVGDAPHGERVARLQGVSVLSSSWLKLSQQCEYLVRVRARAVQGHATLRIALSNYIFPRGSSAGEASQKALSPDQGWQDLSFRWRPPPSAGKITKWAEYFVNVQNVSSGDGHLLVDAVEVKAVIPENDVDRFTPRAAVELAIFSDMPQNVATAGEDVAVTIQATGPVPGTALLILDEEGGELKRLPLRFSDSGRAATVLRGLPCGYWRLQTVSKAAASEVIDGETLLAVVPAMPDVPVTAWSYGSHIPLTESIRRACWKLGLRLDRLHDTGKETKWPTVQPQEGEWVFEDARIDARRATGHLLIGSIAGLPGWVPRAATHPKTGELLPREDSRGNLGMIDETFPLWQEYARRCAAHWQDEIGIWEITNEPNLSGMTPQDYVRLYRAACQGVKEGNAVATVVSLGGATPPGSVWIRETIAAGALQGADALSYHGYGNTTWNSVSGSKSLAASVQVFRASAAEAGHAGIGIWDTECGVEVQTAFHKYYVPHGGDPVAAAEMFPKSVACVRAAGLDRVCYYSAAGTTHAGDGGLRCFSDFNGVMKMPVVPLAVAISMIEGREFGGQTRHLGDDGVIEMRFTGRGKRVRMLWALSSPRSLPWPEEAERIVSMWGREIAGDDTQDGRLQLQVTTAPVYVLSSEP